MSGLSTIENVSSASQNQNKGFRTSTLIRRNQELSESFRKCPADLSYYRNMNSTISTKLLEDNVIVGNVHRAVKSL